MKKNWKIVAAKAGFYFFGEEVEGPDGYIVLVNASMFGGFTGGKGLPGVARGDKKAQVTLDKFGENQKLTYPLSAIIFIADSINLYEFGGTNLR